MTLFIIAAIAIAIIVIPCLFAALAYRRGEAAGLDAARQAYAPQIEALQAENKLLKHNASARRGWWEHTRETIRSSADEAPNTIPMVDSGDRITPTLRSARAT